MFEKCKDLCKYSNIKRELFHGCEILKCSKCNFTTLFIEDFTPFINHIIHEKNIGNIRKYHNINDANDFEKSCINDFRNAFIMNVDKKNFNLKVKCNICSSFLYNHNLRYFGKYKFYICEECNSILFNVYEIDMLFNKLEKYVKFKNLLLKFKILFKLNLYKLKRFFIGLKNNVKK